MSIFLLSFLERFTLGLEEQSYGGMQVCGVGVAEVVTVVVVVAVATTVVVEGKVVWAEVLVKVTSPNKTKEGERRICDRVRVRGDRRGI